MIDEKQLDEWEAQSNELKASDPDIVPATLPLGVLNELIRLARLGLAHERYQNTVQQLHEKLALATYPEKS